MIIFKCFEIAFLIGFVILTLKLFKNDDKFTYLSIQNQINYSMYPMSDEKAMQKLVPCTLSVKNETYKEEWYTLVLKINKSSIMDISDFHISINDYIYSLDDLNKKAENNEIIYILAKDKIIANNKDYNVRIWINESAKNKLKSNDLIFTFNLLNENVKI